jgi:hypothetical protein
MFTIDGTYGKTVIDKWRRSLHDGGAQKLLVRCNAIFELFVGLRLFLSCIMLYFFLCSLFGLRLRDFKAF